MDPQNSSTEFLFGELGWAQLPMKQSPRMRPLSPNHWDKSKRYATYFPSETSTLEAKWNLEDDGSSWEFSAPVVPIMTRSSSWQTFSSSISTPAQQIALQYRENMCSVLRSISNNFSSSGSEYSKSSWETPPSVPGTIDSVPSLVPSVVDENEVLPMYRQSCTESLALARQEITEILENDWAHLKDALTCPRPGCRDTLRNAKALMCHLHIHNIDDRLHSCLSCGKRIKGVARLRHHRCNEEGNTEDSGDSKLVSPIKYSFRRAMKRFCRQNKKMKSL